MPLDRLAEEIRAQGERAVAAERARLEAETAAKLKARDERVTRIRSQILRQTELDIARERAQKLAGARMQARKLEYEAREKAMSESLAASRRRLEAFTRTEEYPRTLKRMLQFATDRLGKELRVYGRSEDAVRLKAVAGKAFVATPVPILGGLVAESVDGSRRLNLSFDELARRRDSELRELLAR